MNFLRKTRPQLETELYQIIEGKDLSILKRVIGDKRISKLPISELESIIPIVKELYERESLPGK